MKITILASVILLILNACQGRNMPLGPTLTKEKLDVNHSTVLHKPKPTSMGKKNTSRKIAEIEKMEKIVKMKKPLSTEKVKHVKTSTQKQDIVKKAPLRKKPPRTTHADKHDLHPLPILPSIAQSKKNNAKQVITPRKKQTLAPTHADEDVANTLMTKIHLPKENFSGGGIVDGLDISSIRIGKSPDYTSIILDSYKYEGKNVLPSKKSPSSGPYLFTYEPSKHRIVGLIDGYKDFSALQSDQRQLFSDSKIVKNMSVLKRMGSDGIKFVITLRKNVRVNIFDVKNPGRIIINLFPL